MPAQFGPTKIGAMQYGGVTIGEAMMNGQVVYRSKLPSIYPVSGTWSATVMAMQTVASHTIVEAGTYTIRHESMASFAESGIRGPWGTTTGGFAQTVSVAEVTVTLTVGALVEFLSGVSFNLATTGTWSITKEALTVITVTPQAPTFLTESPWYTLPTQAGVTYTVSGTPGYGQSVTVTATPQAGYALAGQTSWTHTYGPPPRYTASGSSGSNVVVPLNGWLVINTHTVTHNGDATGEWSVTWIYPRYSGDYAVRVRVNGVTVAEGGPITLNQASYTQSVGIPEMSLSGGDVVEFLAWTNSSGGDYSRTIDQWSWALS